MNESFSKSAFELTDLPKLYFYSVIIVKELLLKTLKSNAF